jgi:1-aminocyclopropane-1-carboxylate deaminase
MSILSALQPLHHPLFIKHNVHVMIKRDDIIHPIISGNKWRKLKYNIEYVKKTPKYTGVLSFGGCYSNHIHALAFACFEQNIPCVGIIRGEIEHADNFTLSWAKHWGMKLHFVDRKTYRRRYNTDYLEALQQQFLQYFIVPEGGSNKLAIAGASEVITELTQQTEFDTLITPVGSGGTLAGLITGDILNNKLHSILGVAVLKNADYLKEEITSLLTTTAKSHNQWRLLTNFHRGGYAKFSPEDITRIIEFSQTTGIYFEPVYSGKMVLAFLDLLEQGYFIKGERIVLLHTGGMQGLGGMIERGRLNAEDWPIPMRVLKQ